MGKFNQGILGGFSGKVGTVVGYSNKGKNVMRALAQHVGNPCSDAQVLQRKRFKLMAKLCSAFNAGAVVGFAKTADEMRHTTFNCFAKHNWGLLHENADGEPEVDFNLVKISAGRLPSVAFRTPKLESTGQVEVEFGGQTDVPMANAYDEVYLYVFQEDDLVGLLAPVAKRSDGKVSLTLPQSWVGRKMHAYGFCVGGGHSNAGLRSDTSYLGVLSLE